MATRFTDHLLTGDHASRPAFGDVPQGTLYSCTDHSLVYQSDGATAWSTWADLTGGGGSGIPATIFDAKGDIIAATAADTAARVAAGADGQGLIYRAGATAGIEPVEVLPWHIDIIALLGGDANTSWDTIGAAASQYGAFVMQATTTQNAEISWNVLLAQGTWSIRLYYLKTSAAGIASVQIDDVEVGTVDMYAASPAYNQRSTVTGVAVATSGKHELSLKMLTKNGSSSNYSGFISFVGLIRTA